MSGATISPVGAPGVTVLLDGAGVDEVLRGTNGPVALWLTDVAQQVISRGRAMIRPGRVTTRTGMGLRDSLVKRLGEDSQGLVMTVIAATDYSLFVHQGTGPHEIRARNVNALHFYSVRAGVFVFAKKVNHPGSRANPFLTTPLRQVIG